MFFFNTHLYISIYLGIQNIFIKKIRNNYASNQNNYRKGGKKQKSEFNKPISANKLVGTRVY